MVDVGWSSITIIDTFKFKTMLKTVSVGRNTTPVNQVLDKSKSWPQDENKSYISLSPMTCIAHRRWYHRYCMCTHGLKYNV